MTDETQVEDVAEVPAPDQDRILTTLVSLANSAGIDQSITLYVGGLIVSGTLVGGRQWADRLLELMRGSTGNAGSIIADGLEEGLHEIYPEPSAITLADELNREPSYIHLDNASIYDAAGRSLPLGSTTWRGRLTSVDAWSTGSFGSS